MASVQTMSPSSPPDPQATPKAKHLSSSHRLDWASTQSSISIDDSLMQDTNVDTCHTPSRSTTPVPGSVKRKRTASSDGSGPSNAEPPKMRSFLSHKRVYDVPLLMSFRTSLAGLTVFAKIRPEALKENLFSHMTAPRPNHEVRHRGFSEISNRSRQNVMVPPPIFTDGPAILTVRSNQLPLQNPEERSEVRRDGFVRFLKQHASPPHNRVTAGGRIVPAGPNSPPPMFNFESLTGMAEQKRRAGTNIPPLSAPPGLGHSSGWPRSRFGNFEDYHNPKQRFAHNMSAATYLQNNFLPYGHQMMPSTPQSALPNMSASLVPVGTLEDGSFISMSNGLFYRTYWNGIGFVVEPLPGPTASLPFLSPIPVQQTAVSAPTQAEGRRSGPAERMPLVNTTNRSSAFSNGDSQVPKTIQALDAQRRNLNEELQRLDRHLALHHYQLSQEQRNQYVSQRRSLIEDIDNIRRVREPSGPDLPVIDVRDLAKRAKGRNSKSRSEQQSSSTGDDLKSGLKPLHLQEKPRKGLSPDAAPFIPGSKIQLSAIESQAPAFTNLSSAQLFKTALPSTKEGALSIPNRDMTRPIDISLDRDTDDPAMRIIHNTDISYASKYEHDIIQGKKKYCSRVYEFQEALRRVRQQAKLYGCAGGSSKDPAYDAEQDIWWAICDKDPIPLPQDPPDHVINPRPWDWNDSAFNHRCIGKAIRREAISIRSTSGDLVNLPAANTGSKSTKSQETSRTHLNQLTAHKSPVIPAKSDRALQEMRNPPGPSGDLARRESLGKAMSAKPIKLPMQKEDHASLKHQQANTRSLKHQPTISGKKEEGPTPTEPKGGEGSTNDSATQSQVISESTLARTDERSSRKSSATSDAVTGPIGRSKTAKTQTNSYKEKSRGPKRTKSKQQMRDANSLRRHRQAVHQAQAAKRPSILNFQDIHPASIHSNADVKPESEVSSEATQTSFLSRTSQQLSPRSAAWKALQFYDRTRTKSPLKPQPSSSQLRPQRARVNIPALAHAHLKNKFKSATPSTGDNKPIAPTTPTRDSFLRDMLRGSRYSSKKATAVKRNSMEETPDKGKPSTSEVPKLVTQGNKENAPAPPPAVKAASADINTSLLENDVFSSNKAPSSLAASTLQATAFLPQFDGAGKARASKFQQERSLDALDQKVKVNLPRGSSLSDPKSGKSLTSPMFGLDGSGDEPSGSGEQSATATKSADDQEAILKAQKKKVKEYDTRGLTEEDFAKVRGAVDNEEHYREVDRFVAKVEKEEQQYMAEKAKKREEGRKGL